MGRTTVAASLAAAIVALAARSSANVPADSMVRRHWDAGQGLPQASVTALSQDRDGFLWVGTFGGLARFDGFSFRQVPLAGTPPVDTFEVLCLLAESDALWVGTDRGLHRLQGGVLAPFTLPKALAGRPIAALHRGRDGTLWLGSANDGLARLADGAFVLEASTGPVPGLARLAEDAQGRLLVWSTTRGILRLADDRVETVPAPGWEAREWFVPRLHEGAAARARPWLAALPATPDAAEESYFVAAMSGDDTVWFGTWRGLFRESTGKSVPVTLGRGGVPVRALLSDRDGSVWAGTDGDGLYQLVPRQFHAITTQDGLPGPSVHGLTGDAFGSLFAALACRGLARIDPAQARVVQAWSAEELGGCPWTALPARGGGVWVGLFAGHLARIGADGRVRTDGPRIQSGTALFRDGRGRVWVGTREHGAFRFTEDPEPAVEAVEGLPSPRVLAFAEDRGARLWIATDRGAAVWEDGRVVPMTSRGLPEVPIRALLADGDRMWVGTFGAGLAVEAAGRFALLDVRRGLFENVVSWIQLDGDWVWWTGNRGVYRARRDELLRAAADPKIMVHPQRFSRADGMPSDETNGGAWPAGWKDAAGRFWIPTIDGLAFVDPSALGGSGEPPRARIEQVLVDGREVPWTGMLDLAPGARLDIVFTAAALAAPDRVRFATRLDGLDADWIAAGSQRRAAYQRLPPGSYLFRVAATDDAGPWSEGRSTLRIEQRPTLAESRPFQVLAGLLVMSLGGALVGAWAVVRRSRAARAGRELARREAEAKRLELRYEAKRADLLRDLHDGIGGIMTNIGIMAALGERESTAEGAPSPMLRRIEALAREGASEVRSFMNAAQEREMHWSDLVAEMRRHAFVLLDGHGIELTLTQEGEPVQPTLDAQTGVSLLRIVTEALHNVVKHSGATTARVRLELAPRSLRLSIRDDGRGMPLSLDAGRGLANMTRRARELGGTLVIQRRPSVELLFDLPLPSGPRRPAAEGPPESQPPPPAPVR